MAAKDAAPPRREPAPAPVPTTVVRAGPPPRGRWADAATGVAGAILLALTVILALSLPVREVLPLQYKVTYASVQADLPAQTFAFAEGQEETRVHEFAYEVAGDDVFQVRAYLVAEDDIASSAPDGFLVRLFDPLGNQVGADVLLHTAPTQQDPGAPFPTYRADPLKVGMTVTYSVALKPEDAIVETPANATREELLTGLAAQHHVATRGTWRLQVSLLEAGDCFTPAGAAAPSQDEMARSLACRQEVLLRSNGTADPRGAGADRGNPLTVGSFSTLAFAVDAERLE